MEKFTASVVDTSGKFATGIVDTGGKFENLSLILVMHLDLWISTQIFKKIWNDLNAILRGLGKDYSWKKPEAKNLK
jgi:hypothetical protein